MKGIIVLSLIIAFFSTGSCFGQNLVPNPSFEDVISCNQPVEWDNYISYSPDYFNSCDGQIPANAFGYQQPYSGVAYMGLFTQASHTINEYREIIGAKLNDSLLIGQKYYVNMKVSLSACVSCATNNLGFLFCEEPMVLGNPIILPNRAHVFSASIITDTANWVSITGSFVSDSAYKYIFVGNFFDNAHTDAIITNPNSCYPDASCDAYYYIDDVCVSTDSLTCNSVTSGVNNISIGRGIECYPNPAYKTIYVNIHDHQCFDYRIVDIMGKSLIYKKNAEFNEIDISSISSGVYFLEITFQNITIRQKQLIIH